MALLGCHVSVAGGLWRAVERGEALGCEAIQIFTKNQLQWRAAPLPLHVCERFFRARRKSAIGRVVAHASYLINIAAPDAVWEKSVIALKDELDRCDQLGIDDLVLHPGSHRGGGRDRGLARAVTALKEVLSITAGQRTRVLLETMSGQGDGLGADLGDLERLIEGCDGDRRLGLCLDTCHLFASGLDLRRADGYRRLIDSMERRFGLDRVGCWHLNDSKEPKGSGKDRHCHLGEGELGLLPFSLIVADERWACTPCILETPKEKDGDQKNMALLRKMRGR